MKNGILWVIAVIVIVGGYFLLHTPSARTQEATTDAMEHIDGMPMQPAPAPEMTSEQQVQVDAGAAVHVPQALTFDVNGGNFYFTPNVIRVKEGDTVTINFKNDGGTHDFKIDEFKAATERTQGGAISTVTFTARTKGSFEYYCSVGTHRQMGMKGTLIVE